MKHLNNKYPKHKSRSWHTGIRWGLIFFLCLLCPVNWIYALENAGMKAPATKTSVDHDLLKATKNPVADLISVPIENITNFNNGLYNRMDNTLSLQPVIPAALSENWLLITRIIQPITWQPYTDRESGGQFGLGDMNPTFFLAPRKPGDLIWGVGPAMVIPTATDSILGQGKISLGPSAVVLSQPGNWTIGALASSIWSVAGSESRPSVSRTSLQYFISYSLKDDWYLISAPTMVADWRAYQDDRWLIPVGGGIGKLIVLGESPIDLAASIYANVVKPSG